MTIGTTITLYNAHIHINNKKIYRDIHEIYMQNTNVLASTNIIGNFKTKGIKNNKYIELSIKFTSINNLINVHTIGCICNMTLNDEHHINLYIHKSKINNNIVQLTLRGKCNLSYINSLQCSFNINNLYSHVELIC